MDSRGCTIAFDDLLGWCYSDPRGKFELRFEESAFKDVAVLDIEGDPELKIRVLDMDGEEVGRIGILRGPEVDFGDIFVSASHKLIAPVLDPTAAAIWRAVSFWILDVQRMSSFAASVDAIMRNLICLCFVFGLTASYFVRQTIGVARQLVRKSLIRLQWREIPDRIGSRCPPTCLPHKPGKTLDRA